ncbi:MAG: hypothetical protein V3T22_08585, partial [Planctomycetota bacterium]
ISVVDLQSLVELRNFPVADQPSVPLLWTAPGVDRDGAVLPSHPQFDLSPDDRTLVLPDHGERRLRFYDFTKGKKSGKQWLGILPLVVEVSPDGTFAVAAELHPYHTAVVRVDLPTLDKHGPFIAPSGLLSPDGLVVANDQTFVGTLDHLSFLDPLTGTLDALQGGAGDLALSHDGRFLVGAQLYGVRVYDVASRSLVSELPLAGQQLAVSPNAQRAVVLQRETGEEIHLIEANGAASFLLKTMPTGMPEEGDAPIDLALAEKAGLVLAANSLSNNVAVVDVVSGQLLRLIPIGERPTHLAVDPAATVAVVATDTDLRVIDPQGGSLLAVLPVAAWGLSVSEDGSEAYALGRYSHDLSIIQLAGAASTVVKSIPVPSHPNHGHFRDRDLVRSSAGLLALTMVNPNQILLYDLPARKVFARLDTGFPPDFVAFAPDGQYLYVTSAHASSPSVLKLQIAESGSLSHTAEHLDLPAGWIAVSDDSQTLYGLSSTPDLEVELVAVDATSLTVLASVPLPEEGIREVELAGPFLLVATADGKLHRYLAAGAATAPIDVLDLGDFPRDLVFSIEQQVALTAQPGRRDGIDRVRYGGSAANYCGPANLNSTGNSAAVTAGGWMVAGVKLALEASGLPPNRLGYFLVSDTQGFVPFVSGSQRNLCLGGSLGRFLDQLSSSGPAGILRVQIDTLALPFDPPTAVQAGETWNFQAWFRDANPGSTSNFTDGVAVTFE